MINKLTVILSKSHNPYENIAYERLLLDQVLEDELILYLWLNDNTIVVGKNQNILAECNLEATNKDNVKIAKRFSGGGAVYHDLGNLNFTFLVNNKNYDLVKQLEVIKLAVNSFGINAIFSGRNDLLVNDKKFSGNAYYKNKENIFHHGTIMINTDIERLSNYLNVSKEKLKGVKSVKSRVVNLKELNPNISVDKLVKALTESLEEVYKLKATKLDEERITKTKHIELTTKLQSKEFLYKVGQDFNYIYNSRYSWGGIELCFVVNDKKVIDVQIFTDALDYEITDKLVKLFLNQEYVPDNLVNILKNSDLDDLLIKDLINLITK